MTKNDAADVDTPAGGENLFDLRMLLFELWRWKWLFVIAAIIGLAVGVRNARHFVPTYEAKMIVMPVEQNGGGASAREAGADILGVARSFGIGGGGVSNSSFDLFKIMVGSTLLADKVQKKHRLMQKVYSGSWDAEKNIWIKPIIDEDSYRQRMRRYFHLNSWHAPDHESLANYLSGIVKISTVPDTAFFKLSVVHPDREFALYLLKIIYEEADEIIGLRRRQEQIERKIYIEGQIETARLVEVQTALLGLLMQLEQQTIIVNSKPPYTVKIISPLHASVMAKEPALNRLIALPIVILVALVLVVIVVIVSFRTE